MRTLIISFLLLGCIAIADEPVNINTADKAALEKVKGIGPDRDVDEIRIGTTLHSVMVGTKPVKK